MPPKRQQPSATADDQRPPKTRKVVVTRPSPVVTRGRSDSLGPPVRNSTHTRTRSVEGNQPTVILNVICTPPVLRSPLTSPIVAHGRGLTVVSTPPLMSNHAQQTAVAHQQPAYASSSASRVARFIPTPPWRHPPPSTSSESPRPPIPSMLGRPPAPSTAATTPRPQMTVRRIAVRPIHTVNDVDGIPQPPAFRPTRSIQALHDPNSQYANEGQEIATQPLPLDAPPVVPDLPAPIDDLDDDIIGLLQRSIIDEDLSQDEQVAPPHERRRGPRTYRVARTGVVVEDLISPHYLGKMDQRCRHCNARFWLAEKTSGSKSNPIFTTCCGNGKIVFPEFEEPPQFLLRLLTGNDAVAVAFRRAIRGYNNNFSFTSMGMKLDDTVANGLKGCFNFRVCGQMVHWHGPLEPDGTPKYAQMYVYDAANEVNNRMTHMADLNPVIVSQLKDMMHSINPFVQTYKYAAELLRSRENLTLMLKTDRGVDRRRYNLPTTEELAVVIPEGDFDPEVKSRDIVLRLRSQQLFRISDLNPNYDPLRYPLLFPHGELGWTPGIPITEGYHGNQVTAMDYYAYRLMIRDGYLHRYGRLFHEYIVDAWMKIEAGRLRFIKGNQDKLRADLFQGYMDAITSGERDLNQVGHRVILPSSFIGSPRFMQQTYQDAMALVRHYGNPGFFVTVTCNPNWPEISDELARDENGVPTQTAADRPDLCARVFRLKLKSIMDDIVKKQIFGRVAAHIHVIEFQKRGLPHAHILLIMASDDNPISPEEFDKAISAEIPDPATHQRLHAIVTRSQLHGPCDTRCLVDGKCSKQFPKAFNEETTNTKDGYPLYKRRNNGRTFTSRNGFVFDNRWVVPYNSYLSLKYDCHINVEVCSGVRAVKYLYKYVYKGHDRALFAVEEPNKEVNEILLYRDARYVSTSEALWRILGFSLHEEFPSICRLDLHLPNQHVVYFKDGPGPAAVDQRLSRTKLTAFFELCRSDDFAKTLTYPQVCEHYTWVTKDRIWRKRQKGHGSIGRVYTASPASEEYHLRLLLYVVQGPTSFEAVRSIGETVYDTFLDACRARNLVENADEVEHSLIEACQFQMPSQLRRLFAAHLEYSKPPNPATLWAQFENALCEDYMRQAHVTYVTDAVRNKALTDIERCLNSHGKSLSQYDLPVPVEDDLEAAVIREETEYDIELLKAFVAENKPKLNPEQLAAFNAIEAAVSGRPEIFMLRAHGGCGKTYLFNLLLASVRSRSEIALACASSGIAALLLSGGRTAHFRFKIPLNTHDTSTCAISKRSALAELIRRAKLIIWDEGPMMSRYTFEAVDRTLRDIRDNQAPFGGLTVVIGGDFRQCLPVVPRGGRLRVVEQVLTRAKFWPKTRSLTLSRNMRVVDDPAIAAFPEWLLQVGDGKAAGPAEFNGESIFIPDPIVKVPNIHELLKAIYADLRTSYRRADYLADRCILATRNDEVDRLNERILSDIPEQEFIYLSADSVTNPNLKQFYPEELLHTFTPPSLPPHRLVLKIGAPIILIRNLDPSSGLCNGTRMTVRRLRNNVIEAEVLTGTHRGTIAQIPRIPLVCDQDGSPVEIVRRQFPIRLAFCMTVNKSQGQTFNYVGLALRECEVFAHGQLYVAVSRVTDPRHLYIYCRSYGTMHITKNTVFHEAFP